VLEANSQGNALARLFNLPEARAATLANQNFLMALVIELLIVISLVASEVLEHHETKPPAAQSVGAQAHSEPVEAPSGLTALPYDEQPKALPQAPRQRLIAPRLARQRCGDHGGHNAAGRAKVEIADVFAAYADACEASGKRPIPANEFPAAIAALCERLRIKIEDTAQGVFLRRMRIRQKTATKEPIA
jgi:hypothetical protein